MSLSQTLYDSAPALRDIAATLNGLWVRHDRYGATYRSGVAEILRRDAASPDQMADYQAQQLQRTVGDAARYVPYYRDLFCRLGLDPRQIRSAADLRLLPVLHKGTVRRQPLHFVDERVPRRELEEDTTSGTTGTPIRVHTTRQARQLNYAYFEARCRLVAGLHYGHEPYVMFGARYVTPVSRTQPPFWCFNHAARQLYMSVYHLAPEYLRHYRDELLRRPYRALLGYPSVMATVGQYLLDHFPGEVRIPIAITNGETLHPHQRATIERAFGARVFDQYGCVELAAFAAERPCGHLHVSPDYGIVEILDDADRPVPPGVSGRLVCTGLINRAQILLRYDVGDTAAWSAESCPCAPALPVLERIDGRTAHAITLADGRKVFRVNTVVENIGSIREAQIVQEAADRFTILAVADGLLADSHREELAANLRASLGDVRVWVEQVERIPRGPGGKFAFIVSKVR